MEGCGERSRIYVGGLGEKVTSDDLEKMLSPALGHIEVVDLIKTKGRCFAYLDFVPSSPSSLPKLFSTYNGCVWKGGRLRLEKAKEHYLARLKREWTEESEIASSVSVAGADQDAGEEAASLKVPRKELSTENKKLHIFFPRLRKVKAIPFSGTGKHRYSFRRVEVPPLPRDFCDCEEHSGPPDINRKRESPRLEEQCVGMNEEEISMMNSVMHKLFVRENVAENDCNKDEMSKEADDTTKMIDNLQLEEDVVDSAADEEDNLIINMVGPGHLTVLASEVSRLKESLVKDGPTQKVAIKRKRIDASPPKKRRAVAAETKDANGSVSAISGGEESCQAYSHALGKLSQNLHLELESGGKQSIPGPLRSRKSSWKELVGDGGNNVFNISDILPGIGSSKEEESKSNKLALSSDNKDDKFLRQDDQKGLLSETTSSEQLAEAQNNELKSTSNKSGRGAAWLHKCSWTQLIGRSSSNVFSVAQILRVSALEKQEPAIFNHGAAANSTDNNGSDKVEECKNEPTTDGKIGLTVVKDSGRQNNPDNSHAVCPPVTEQNGNSDKMKSYTEDVAIGDTCLFMRTQASVKEWANTKAALSGSRKRKKE